MSTIALVTIAIVGLCIGLYFLFNYINTNYPKYDEFTLREVKKNYLDASEEVKYLFKGEQIIFKTFGSMATKSFQSDEPVTKFIFVTDDRILYASSVKKEGAVEINYSDITNIRTSRGRSSVKIHIFAHDKKYAIEELGEQDKVIRASEFIEKKVEESIESKIDRDRDDTTVNEIYDELSENIERLLIQAGYHTVEDFEEVDKDELTDMRLIGHPAAERILNIVDTTISGRTDADSDISTENDLVSNDETKLERKFGSINSKISDIDDHIRNGEISEAKKLKKKVEEEINTLKKKKQESDASISRVELRDIEKECRNCLSKSHILTLLRNMDPYEFEKFVAKIWEKRGWNTEVTSDSADRGIDIIASKEDTFENRQHLIQVKRYSEKNKVGSDEIQKYTGLYTRHKEEVDSVFVVTTGYFTKEAKNVAEEGNVQTINCDDLYEMFIEA